MGTYTVSVYLIDYAGNVSSPLSKADAETTITMYQQFAPMTSLYTVPNGLYAILPGKVSKGLCWYCSQWPYFYGSATAYGEVLYDDYENRSSSHKYKRIWCSTVVREVCRDTRLGNMV